MTLLPAFVLGTDYNEVYPDSGKETYSQDNSSAERVFLVPWDHKDTFLLALLGWSLMGATAIQRELPDQHPALPGFYCMDASSQAWGKPHIANNYVDPEYAK